MAKNKKRKKVAKKIVKRKQVHSKNEIVIRVEAPVAPTLPIVKESDLGPIKDSGKYMMVKGFFNQNQVLRMLQKTPPQHVKTRPGKGGGTFDYVTGTYVKKVLNYITGWMWSFDIISTEEKYGQVIVRGKLTIQDQQGKPMVSKSDSGKADIKFKKNTTIPLDYGNDEKAAITDCIKRCASQLGIASDIYGKEEFKDVGVDVQPDSMPTATEAPQVLLPTASIIETAPQDYVCHGATKGGCPDGADITKKEHDFTMKICGKPLCRKCFNQLKGKK